jgi:hypothetical protein
LADGEGLTFQPKNNNMSTRANIVIKAHGEELWFYRHWDGYPEGTMPSLRTFMEWLRDGRIRTSLGQSAGWLVIIGNTLYNSGSEPKEDKFSGWKVGAYEPTTGQHGDIEFLYTINLGEKSLTCHEVDGFGDSAKVGKLIETA